MTYTYDALNRLATAQATSAAWGQSYTYDGFGNLTDQNVIAGSAPMFHAVYNPLTNNDSCADANGNETCFGGLSGYGYDVENRLRNDNNGFFKFSYAPGNKRIWRGDGTGGNGGMVLTSDEVAFWGVSGQKLATYQLVVTEGTSQSPSASMFANQTGTNYYFGGKLIKNASGYLATDRLGSIGKYYPYGQEKGTGNPATGEKFTGYFRDGETGLDYADQRYHNPGAGRFMTPDRYTNSAGPTDPGSWNRYAYTRGDPVGRIDPSGTCDILPGGGDDCEPDVCDPNDPETYQFCDLGPPPPPSPPTTTPPPPCWTNWGDIYSTLNSIGQNIDEIAATVVNNAGELAGLTSLISATVSEEFTSIVLYEESSSAPPSGPDFVGGHFNLIIPTSQLTGIFGGASSPDYASFGAAFGGRIDGTRQPAVYGNAAQGNYTLHSKQHGNNSSGSYSAHFDKYNPGDVVGTIQHFFGDVFAGHIGSPCLDPAWQQ